MEENVKNELAVRMFDCIDELLPEIGIRNYSKDEDELKFRYIINGDDIPMNFVMRVVPSAGIISLLSPFSFKIKDKNIVNASIAVSATNNSILNGSFDLDVFDGSLCFRISTCYTEELVDMDVLRYLVAVASNTVDRYNDRLLALNKNIISLDEYLQWINEVNSN